MTYVVKFDESAKQIILAGLDLLVRDIGDQLKAKGGPLARDAASKIISVSNVAIGIEQATKFEEASEEEVNKDAAEGGAELPGQEPR